MSKADNTADMEKESAGKHTLDANDVSLGDPEQKGLLSFIGDPIGKGLDKGLSPVGNMVGGLAQPFGSGESNTDRLTGNTKKEDESLKPVGGKEQTGQNPLGL